MEKKLSERKSQQTSNSKSSNKSNSSSTSKKKRSKRPEKTDWFTEEPLDVHKKRPWNNREWNWCGADTGGKCEAFVIHSPTECKGFKRSQPGSKKKASKCHTEEN